VEELLLRMGFRGQVTARWGESVEPPDVRPLLVDVRGRDLQPLIGRRGETLSALQYLTRLIVAKELGTHVAILIDIDGYRARREDQLRRLARRMADQAVETARTMVLEPMSPYERRIIHLELHDHPSVYTESVGEGDRRKVTIIPRS
jgi:spoIIIJ-associated protein